MIREYESVDWDPKNNGVIITRLDRISVDDQEIDGVKRKLREELNNIIRQVKSLKSRAEEVKTILAKIENRAESIDSALPVELE